MDRLIASMFIMMLTSCTSNYDRAEGDSKIPIQANRPIAIKPFALTLLKSNYRSAYSVEYFLSETALKIIFYGEAKGNKDSVIYARKLKPTEQLQKMSEVNLDSLEVYYNNPCMEDGSILFVEITKGGKKKHVQLSNYYHPEIGKVIELINALAPKKYKIWYDKQRLMRELKECYIGQD